MTENVESHSTSRTTSICRFLKERFELVPCSPTIGTYQVLVIKLYDATTMASKPVPSGESLILLEKSAATMDEEEQMEMGYSQHLDDVSPNDAENPVEEDTAIVVENEKLPIGQYLRSGDFREIICCFIFGVLCMLTQYPGIPVNMRPIPFQYLENSAEYALNQVNAAEYTGDTVSNAAVTIIGFLAPLVLQL